MRVGSPVSSRSRRAAANQLMMGTYSQAPMQAQMPLVFAQPPYSQTIQSIPNPMMPTNLSRERESCWVSNLKEDISRCTPGFRAGQGHLKNKFCPACRLNGISIPAEGIRVLTPELEKVYRNARNFGFWSVGPKEVHFRVINNTVGTGGRGPRLIIFRDPPPANASEPLPGQWITTHGQVLMLFELRRK